ncbi:hypothetical protein DPMN_117971 [Dreissena polymorpha]|uniref:EGF-like domain-containing protein n=1 Tax=Dreissena polymorpha TaxID=45954 RepID=A0A9D4JLF9_DREPO|nr:hypothetical protein DPMN_117971 [Dreissena polymorpha]
MHIIVVHSFSTRLVFTGICVCQSNCSSPADACQTVCSGHGTCDKATDSCVCHDGLGLNVKGQWGALCEESDCPGENEPCSGHGLCIQGSCTCNTVSSTFNFSGRFSFSGRLFFNAAYYLSFGVILNVGALISGNLSCWTVSMKLGSGLLMI